jgi:hypothetical protein
MIKIDFFDFNIDDYEFICHKCMLDDEYKKLLEMEIKGYSRIKMACGKKLNEDMAEKWVKEMKPAGLHWTIEETTSAMQSLGYNLERIDFYVVANMMYNDYFDLVKDDEVLALKMAKDWLEDIDSSNDKLYKYWKYIANID